MSQSVSRGWWTFRLVLKLSTINISLSLPISLQPLYNKISDTDLTCIGIHLASLNGKFNFLTQSQKEGNIKYTNYCIKYKQKMHMKQTTKAQNQRQYNEVNHEFESKGLYYLTLVPIFKCVMFSFAIVWDTSMTFFQDKLLKKLQFLNFFYSLVDYSLSQVIASFIF